MIFHDLCITFIYNFDFISISKAIIAFGLMDLMDLLDLMDLFLHEGECVYGICSSNVTNLLAFLSVIICLVTIIVLTYQRRIVS